MSHFLYKCSKERREETKEKYFRGVEVINILSGLPLVLVTGAIIIVMQNFSGWLPKSTAEKLKYFMNIQKVYVKCASYYLRKAEMHS